MLFISVIISAVVSALMPVFYIWYEKKVGVQPIATCIILGFFGFGVLLGQVIMLVNGLAERARNENK